MHGMHEVRGSSPLSSTKNKELSKASIVSGQFFFFMKREGSKGASEPLIKRSFRESEETSTNEDTGGRPEANSFLSRATEEG